MNIGGSCHEAMVNGHLEDPLYDDHTNIIPEVLSEAERIWNECILLAADVSPTPPRGVGYLYLYLLRE